MEKIESYKLNNTPFVLYKKKGFIQNGGFSLDSIFQTQKAGSQKEYEKENDFLAIPFGLFHSQKKHSRHENKQEDRENISHIPDELYEKLLGLASVEDAHQQKSVKKETIRKRKNNIKTRKHNKDKITI